ncbi:MAG: peptidase E [Gemmatimonadetes bacterium]|nr:peptidase E [Gemmatimonadota bacterium]
MQRRDFLVSSTWGLIGLASAGPFSLGSSRMFAGPRKVLIAGGGYGRAFIAEMARLTGKERPRLLYLPTASADSPGGTISWFQACAGLNVEPYVQNAFISSYTQKQSWEEVLLSMDGIVASGGNTLNQQAIWKAQGIDVVLRDAWDRGIVLGGASAGSICWFDEGTTDSRPKELSVVQGLGFIKGSHCPHYDREAERRPLYLKLVGTGMMKPGYACDNDAGLYFEDNEVKRVVCSRVGARVFHVTRSGDQAVERQLQPETIA